VQLTTPDGSAVELDLVAQRDDGLVVATDAATWDRIHANGWFHTGGTHTEHPFESDRPVQVELVLDPTADDATLTEAWWASTATQSVDVPDGTEGELREGVRFPDPPWRAGLAAAWGTEVEEKEEQLLDLVTAVFLSQGWDVERPEPDSTVVQVDVPPTVGDFELWVRTIEEQQIITVISIVRVPTPADRIPDVLELAARMNGVLSVGSFEVDADSGLLSFKNGVDVEGFEPGVNLVRQLVGHAVVAAERGRPLLEGVLAGNLTPRGAASLL
jgi:hypothetical protein